MKLKLLFIIEHYDFGAGLENSAIRISHALNERGHEIHICCNSHGEFQGIFFHKKLENVESVINTIKPDIVIDFNLYHQADLHVLGQGTHKGYLSYYIDAFDGIIKTIKQLEFKFSKHKRKIRKQESFLKNPKAFFWANSYQTEKMAIEGGVSPDRIRVHHEPVDLTKFNLNATLKYREELRGVWGLQQNDIAFLYVAHNIKLKNLKLLLKVFSKINNNKAKLVIVGKRCPKRKPENVIYAGTFEKMEKVYAAGDVLLHPTFFDSCANVVLEAMSSSRPVIVSNTAGVNECVRDNKDGWVLPVRGKGYEQNWIEKINMLIDNNKLRNDMGCTARQTAEKHTFNEFICWFEEYLYKILSRK